MISGKTTLIAHVGYPTESFKAPLIYNPWFDSKGIDAVVVPMGVKTEDYPAFFDKLVKLTNLRGALVTMPHKVATVALLDEASTAVKVAGSCNAVLVRDDGKVVGDMFDGAGFARGLKRKGFDVRGKSCLIAGTGGVGSAIAASLAADGITRMALFDMSAESADGLAQRLRQYYPAMQVTTGSNDPAGFDLIVNATPLGMKPGDPMPFDVSRITKHMFVGEVVMKQEITPLLDAARRIGCRTQVGTDMLFEQIPAYLEFFGFGTTTAEELRAVAKVSY
jgi:shikimate dehydrogenase